MPATKLSTTFGFFCRYASLVKYWAICSFG